MKEVVFRMELEGGNLKVICLLEPCVHRCVLFLQSRDLLVERTLFRFDFCILRTNLTVLLYWNKYLEELDLAIVRVIYIYA